VITAYLVGDHQLLERLRSLPETIGSRLVGKITELGIELQRNVQQERLSGQVLNTRSGALRSSIDLRIDRSAARVTASVFTDLRYGAAHEYGFAGTVGVKDGLRRIKEAFGRPIAEKLISVRAHERRMNLPERSFLRSALDDMTPAISEAVDAALAEAASQ
jgi:phage gpG-like protein